MNKSMKSECGAMQIYSFCPFGYEGNRIGVEAELSNGPQAFSVDGLTDCYVTESRVRIEEAIKSCGLKFPDYRILVTLSPTAIRKDGDSFEFAMALSILEKSSPTGFDKRVLVMGSLREDGYIGPTRGLSAAIMSAAEDGIKYAIVPKSQEGEATGKGVPNIFGADTLREAFEALQDEKRFVPSAEITADEKIEFLPIKDGDDNFIHCSRKVRDALVMAAAGRHNILLYKEPESEKLGPQFLGPLYKFEYLMPTLTREEAYSVTRIQSLAGILKQDAGFVKYAPLRVPHFSATTEGMCGGGIECRPGEMALAHNGALFLDEASDFKILPLHVLRFALDSRTVILSRAGRSTDYPADFQLLMTAKPCDCGNYGSENKVCLCRWHRIEDYMYKFTPLFDGIEIILRGDKDEKQDWDIGDMRREIADAVKKQRERGVRNARMSADTVAVMPEYSEAEGNPVFDDLSLRVKANVFRLLQTSKDLGYEYTAEQLLEFHKPIEYD